MADAISLSSDDSDVEIVGTYNKVLSTADPLPLSAVRVDVDVVSANVPPRYIDLTDPKWTPPDLKIRRRQNSTAATVVDLTETVVDCRTEQDTENLPPHDCQIKRESTNKNVPSKKQDFNLQKSSSRDVAFFAPQQGYGNLIPKRRCLNSQTQDQKQTIEILPFHHTAGVKLNRLPFLDTHYRELKTLHSTCLTEDCSETPQCISNLRLTGPNHHMEHSLDEPSPKMLESVFAQEQENSNRCEQLHDKIPQQQESPADPPCSVTTSKEPSMPLSYPTSPSSSHSKAQREILCSDLEQLELDEEESRKIISDYLLSGSPTNELNPSEHFDLKSLSHSSPITQNVMKHDPTAIFEHTPAENASVCQVGDLKADGASDISDVLCSSIPSEPHLSETEDMEEECGTGTCNGDLGIDSPESFLWQEWSDREELNEESRFDMDFRDASKEDRDNVCLVALKKIMSGPVHASNDAEEEGFGPPEVLCRQSLSLVYSTIDENYPEGTLQLLSDLLQPGYYPPRDITTHLLHGILLDIQCPHHLCVQAFNLLMRTQRHHIADKTTVPWDWELLTSVMANQRYRCEIVRMLLEYVVQTLEDDFQAKRSIQDLHHSIAKATLSCDQHFPQVKVVIKWLFVALGESRKRDEQIRMVSIFERMLSLALEVDRSPALSSAKLSQELFHMLISSDSLRAQRTLLLESLQSSLLKYKLLEHLLDYACPLKIALPMSLSLLLHFLKNCTLEPDPTDGIERWKKWEELVHLLWMLLLSYNKAMKGCLNNAVTEQSGRVGMAFYRAEDKVSKEAIREAIDVFLSRSRADLGEPLPLHVEESLSYLQDHLLDVCQC